MGFLDTLSGATQGIRAGSQALRDLANGKLPVADPGTTVPFWSFEVWDEKGRVDGAWSKVAFQWPPTAMQYDQGIRADVGLDLLGQPSVSLLGPGLGRLTLQGSHGVCVHRKGRRTGLEVRDAFRDIFRAWLGECSKAQAARKPYPKLVLAVRNGGPTEWKSEEIWVWPVGFPSDERDASRPLEWRYSVNLMVLGNVVSTVVDCVAPMPPDVLKVGTGMLDQLKALAKKATAIRAEVTKVRNTLGQTIGALKDARKAGLNLIQEARREVQIWTAMATDLNRLASLPALKADISAELKGLSRDCQRLGGQIRVAAAQQVQIAAAPITAALPQGPASIQRLASSALGDSRRWVEIAKANPGVPLFPGVPGTLRLPER